MYLPDHVADALTCLRHCGVELCPVDLTRLRRDIGRLGSERSRIIRDRLAVMCREVKETYATMVEPAVPEVQLLLAGFEASCAASAREY
jgi:hypothetical protein